MTNTARLKLNRHRSVGAEDRAKSPWTCRETYATVLYCSRIESGVRGGTAGKKPCAEKGGICSCELQDSDSEIGGCVVKVYLVLALVERWKVSIFSRSLELVEL